MLTPKLPDRQGYLVAVPQSIRVILSEDRGTDISLMLNPTEDLREIESLRDANFSINKFAEATLAQNSRFAAEEYDVLASKFGKFENSPVYLHRLASLAYLAGRSEDEERLHKRALDLGGDAFYAHQLGEFFLEHGRTDEAESLFSLLDLQSDVAANLRMASFCVYQKNLSEAASYVRAALDIDPSDFSARLFDGGLALYSRDHGRAILSFRLALNERPTSSVTYCNLAIAYLAGAEERKALASLRRSVALDPLNSNAIAILADLAFSLNRDEDAIPSLRYFVQLEQTNEGVWSRLARACFRIGSIDEAVAALKRQASIRQSAGVWNNLGVAYLKLGLRKKGFESFVYAMKLEQRDESRDYFLAARNVISMLSENESHQELETIASAVLASGKLDVLLKYTSAADLVAFYLHSLFVTGRSEEAGRLVRRFLSFDEINDSLKLWLVGALIGYKALRGGDDEIWSVIRDYEALPSRLVGTGGIEEKVAIYYNNIAFALIEMGDLASADGYMQKIMRYVHKNAYPTATFGLMQFRRGKIDRAKELYQEAIGLARTGRDKSRIRQKMNLELAKVYLSEHPSRARSLLEKVAAEREGESALSKQARTLLDAIAGKRSR